MPDVAEVVALLEESVFGEPGTLYAGRPIDEVEGWDSAAMVFFMGEAAGRWGVQLSADDLRACRTIEDLARRIAVAR